MEPAVEPQSSVSYQYTRTDFEVTLSWDLANNIEEFI